MPTPDPEILVTQFNQTNFFEYALDKFLNNPKFPFDIFGNLPQPEETDYQCPTVVMFDYEKELCVVNEGLSVLKYPVWIAWLIKLVLSI